MVISELSFQQARLVAEHIADTYAKARRLINSSYVFKDCTIALPNRLKGHQCRPFKLNQSGLIESLQKPEIPVLFGLLYRLFLVDLGRLFGIEMQGGLIWFDLFDSI